MKAWRLVGVIYAGALCGGLLAASGVLLAGEGQIVAEGIALPVQTAPRAVSVAPERIKTGPSGWAFWSALGAQGATCATQEYGFAKFGVYGAAVGTRLRSCALNVGPVIAVKVFGKWLKRADADMAVIPSIGWGVYGTAKNLHDIRKIDRLLKEAK